MPGSLGFVTGGLNHGRGSEQGRNRRRVVLCFIYTFHTFLLMSSLMPSNLLGLGNTAENKSSQTPASMELVLAGEMDKYIHVKHRKCLG